MSELQDQVLEFHDNYDLPVVVYPAVPSEERVRLRLSLIAEEFFELLVSAIPEGASHTKPFGDARYLVKNIVSEYIMDVNLPEFVDALADLDYVIEGTRLEFGVDGAPIAREVHRSNMSKLGEDGMPVRRADGKILKGPNFTPPNIERELRLQGWKPPEES